MSDEKQTCPNCHGFKQVVQPVQVWDNQQKKFVLLDHAGPCKVCGGTGEI